LGILEISNPRGAVVGHYSLEPEVKEYKIITLGASGAGKTVFLSSLFKELSTQGKHGFYLDVDDVEQRKRLNDIYTGVITGDVWPTSTRYSEISNWTFNCRIKTENLSGYSACKFTYYDYAGGRLTDGDEDLEFTELVKQADSLLGLLDGQKLRALMTNGNDFLVNTFLKRDLPGILRHMRDSSAPIHFVISKWDVLTDEFPLSEVRTRLLQIPEFEELVHARKRLGSPVRLIPVSSVGFRFARVQPDGSMKKISGAVPRPFQTEAPLACVFPDGLKARINELRQKQKQLEQKKVENQWQLIASVLETVRPIAGVAYGLFLEFLPLQYRLAKPMLEKLGKVLEEVADKGGKEFEKRAERLQKEQQESLRQVKDESTALKHAIDSFLYVQSLLIRDFPDSDLSLG
jgi:hypothetical protein